MGTRGAAQHRQLVRERQTETTVSPPLSPSRTAAIRRAGAGEAAHSGPWAQQPGIQGSGRWASSEAQPLGWGGCPSLAFPQPPPNRLGGSASRNRQGCLEEGFICASLSPEAWGV